MKSTRQTASSYTFPSCLCHAACCWCCCCLLKCLLLLVFLKLLVRSHWYKGGLTFAEANSSWSDLNSKGQRFHSGRNQCLTVDNHLRNRLRIALCHISLTLEIWNSNCKVVCVIVCLCEPQQQYYGPFQAASPARANAASVDSALLWNRHKNKELKHSSYRQKHLESPIFKGFMFNISKTSQRSTAVAEGKIKLKVASQFLFQMLSKSLVLHFCCCSA